MAAHPQHNSYFTHIDVSAQATSHGVLADVPEGDTTVLLQHMIQEQRRQTQLLEELVQQMGAAQRQRANELGQWKEANPYLAKQCRKAAESLSGVQTEFLRSLTEEINDHAEDFMDGEFMLNEFVDRYGPRLAHLNGVLQVLSQLSSMSQTSGSAS
ncbi:MAG TPA: hypothetical protein VIY86_04700 [Pirellulaceae bacterium]